MECERFKRLLKSWYMQVQDEALAPARMVSFMEAHLEECPVCMMDPEARKDVKKIITLALPQDKLKTPARSSRKADPNSGEKSPEEEEYEEGDTDSDSDESSDTDDDFDEEDDIEAID